MRVLDSYDNLAAEYYDAARHPTSANFREASALILSSWNEYLIGGRVCEVGAGASLADELLTAGAGLGPHQLILLDSSFAMLAHSRKALPRGAQLVLADAELLPLADQTVDVLIASLGDAYNSARFWSGACRTLSRSGVVLYTSPSFEWAREFRKSSHDTHSAEFELVDGRVVDVPSYVLPLEGQVDLIESNGLLVKESTSVTKSARRSTQLSAKLSGCSDDDPIVTGYVAIKR
jgi:SAM-dependent methyltransferase